jgi:diacylglycerol kinase family enzyme
MAMNSAVMMLSLMSSNCASKFSEVISFQKARIQLSQNIAHYDGEPFDVRSELNIQVVPKSLNILIGKK